MDLEFESIHHSMLKNCYYYYFSQSSNLLNQARLRVLKAREDHIQVNFAHTNTGPNLEILAVF